MSEPERPLLADLKARIAAVTAELREMAVLRWQLAQLEWQTAAGQLKRLAVAGAVVAVMALTSLPILAVAATDLLDGSLGISRTGWLAVFGLLLLAGSAAGGWLAWRRFRRRWSGMEQTLEELREDLVWLEEWTK
jgi:protein-S-isoprenylcysteine O-methyltransferase Ste14